MKQQLDQPKTILAWSLYDWANSAFATTIMAAFFPIFFNDYWSVGSETTVTTARLAFANSIGSILVAVMAPVLGAIADQSTAKKKFLFFFAYLGIVMTFGLYLVGQGNWQMAILLYVLAAIGFSSSNIFYDSLLTGVASEKKMDIVSTFGFSMGYLGGGVLFALNVAMTLYPETFGLSGQAEAVRVSFISVAIWWAVFSIPIFLFVKEPENRSTSSESSSKSTNLLLSGFQQVAQTFGEIKQRKHLFLFLLAYFLYIDGVDTIVRMSVDYGRSLGFETSDLISALLLTQFIGFPAAIAFGFLGNKIGTKRAIFIAIGVYLFITIWGGFIQVKQEFYLVAATIGLVQGGIQGLSRSLYGRMIPLEKSAQYFGFYNMVGKSAAIFGPLLMGGTGLLVQSLGYGSNFATRLSIISVALLFIVGGTLFYFVDEQKAKGENNIE